MALAMAYNIPLYSPTNVTRVHISPSTPSYVSVTTAAAVTSKKRELVGRREGLSVGIIAAAITTLSFSGPTTHAAILEADDDLELLEKVKKDRQKRLQKQDLVTSSKKETGYLQDLVYKLSKAGQAIESNDFSVAGDILGPSTGTGWVKNVNIAFTKLSSSPEEKTEAEAFNTSLKSLISSVGKRDIESSRAAFVSSANALEKWIALSDLAGQLKGL